MHLAVLVWTTTMTTTDKPNSFTPCNAHDAVYSSKIATVSHTIVLMDARLLLTNNYSFTCTWQVALLMQHASVHPPPLRQKEYQPWSISMTSQYN